MVESNIRELLQTIAIQTRKSYARELRKLGLHIGQELALFHLWEEDGITQSQLRNKVGSEASTMSNMLRKLEQDEIIYRRHDDVDSRISKVYLTDKGIQLQGPIEDIWSEHEKKLFNGISSEELILMKRTLQQMSENLAHNSSF